jgi:hypothetical protein
MCNELQVRISAHQLQSGTIQELGAMLVPKWEAIPVTKIRNLIWPMERPFNAVIDYHGSYIRY